MIFANKERDTSPVICQPVSGWSWMEMENICSKLISKGGDTLTAPKDCCLCYIPVGRLRFTHNLNGGRHIGAHQQKRELSLDQR